MASPSTTLSFSPSPNGHRDTLRPPIDSRGALRNSPRDEEFDNQFLPYSRGKQHRAPPPDSPRVELVAPIHLERDWDGDAGESDLNDSAIARSISKAFKTFNQQEESLRQREGILGAIGARC
eukprot:GHVU01006557.1.p1 GENE.GHVU01006557.1~~GHVU01006557.1.p1  ORF type:complete len:141 (-),score=6.14 GHVU01006557.1:236-601(-)